jgi:ribosomal protein S18 acetylase RimI-like enzyme
MNDQQNITVRAAQYADRLQINNLIHFGSYVHRHMDWRRPTDWIGHQPFVVAERQGRLLAALACPRAVPPISWIRFFSVAGDVSKSWAWEELWNVVLDQLSSSQVCVTALPMDTWFQELLESSQFEHFNNVVVLTWEWKSSHTMDPPAGFQIREMEPDDLQSVQKVDAEAFNPIWQMPGEILKEAFNHAAIASVAEIGDEIIGYQISTASSQSGHLARLAVNPEMQGQGVGIALVQDVLAQFLQVGALKITVNTQTDNLASLALYKKAGFQRTEDVYPVYRMNL